VTGTRSHRRTAAGAWTLAGLIARAALIAVALCGAPSAAVAAAAAPSITVAFDHLTTGFELDGVHRDLPCESCHLNAVFKGTPRDCAVCHSTGSPFNATPKTATHIPTTNDCAACHNTIAFRPDVHFDHAEVLGSCVSCHNGSIAQGEGPNHPRTSQNCAACHTVISWTPTKAVDHTQIPLAVAGFCIVCHNGTAAAGKPASHIPTQLECGDCHLTTTWLGANFDHTGITSGCAACHNGVKAVGKQGNHMPTSNTCEACHRTGLGSKSPSWAPAGFDHTQMAVSTCATCHSGSVKITTGFVSGQPTNHMPPIPSTVDCSVCHGNNPAAETWGVLAASIPVLHSGLSVTNCLMCHAGQTFAGLPAPYIPMSISGVSPTKKTPLAPLHIPILANTDCSACHGPAYQAGGFGPATAMSAAKHAFVVTTCDTCHDTGKSFYVGAGTALQLRPQSHVTSTDSRMATADCSTCHTTSDWKSAVLPIGHMPNPAALPCRTCHASSPHDYAPATLAANAALHTGISGNCGQCHGNTTTVLTWFNAYTPKNADLTPVAHIPYLAGTDCSSCHASTTYAVGGFGPTLMSAAKHAFVPTACDTCHEAGLNFYLGSSPQTLQGRPKDHLTSGNPLEASGDCSGCHTTTDWTTNILPAGHMPNPGKQACAVCHIAIDGSLTGYAKLAAIPVLHTGVTGSCGACHGAFTALTWTNAYTPKDAVLAPARHIPFLNGADCSNCHAQNFVAGGFGPTNMSAAKHAFVPTTCDTCHQQGSSFYVNTAATPQQVRPANHLSSTNPQQVTGDCNGCHETTDWIAKVLPANHMPNPGNQACAVCHVAAPTDYSKLAVNAVLHTGITSGCSQCHGGATALTFYNNNDNPLSGALSPAHIPAFNGTDCSNCHTSTTYATGTFGPMNMTQSTHAFAGTTCNPCHEANLNFFMGNANPKRQGRPNDHTTGAMVAPNDCNLCHTPAGWGSNTLPVGHMPNPASQACSVCHTTAPTDYSTATLAANAVLHTGITASECAQCHGGPSGALTWANNFTPKDAVLSPAHIPILPGTSCGSCHTTTTFAVGSFGPTNMTQAMHGFVVSTCDTCHEAGLSFTMGLASPGLQGRPKDHTTGQMVAPNDCGICHTTGTWATSALPAGHMPNPANQGCTVCHTTAPADYSQATLASHTILHTGITSGCIACHGAPSATPPVFANGFTPKSAQLTPVHIPTGVTPCEDCHTPSNFTSFNGPTTMSSTKHSAMFAFIGGTCDACHNAVSPALNFYGVSNLTTRPGDHSSGNKKNNDCGSGCHNTNQWKGGSAVRKTVSTANAARATIGLVVSAPAASRGAATAGAATARIPLSHAGVTGNCASCHDGVLAQAKGPKHIASNAACENCHTTLAWLPARFEHHGVTASCASCHDGVLAPGLSARHIPTGTEDCGACHGTIAWTTATFSHRGVTQSCRTCHDGLAAIGKQPQHPTTTADCGSCHVTSTWTMIAAAPRARAAAAPHGASNGPSK
jgi:hypothetical protein